MGDSNYINFLSGPAETNRMGWFRDSSLFLNTAASDASARWLLFKAGEPLTRRHQAEKGRSLAYLTTQEVKSLLGEARFFGQAKEPGEDAMQAVREPKVLQAARLRGPNIVFLGVKEKEGVKALPIGEFKSAQDLPGIPFFAVDVTKVDGNAISEILRVASEADSTNLFEFSEPRTASVSFSPFEASLFALARSMIDWNARNRFCAGCGSPVYSLWGGWKLSCSTLLPWAENGDREECITAKGLHNFAHPRTDACVIMVILDDKADRILLGNNKRFPPGMYSALAGFMEPAETFEDAIKREIYEECGLHVHDVQYHSTQPWPYPANLMIGFYCYADAQQAVRLDLDTELQDAKWFTKEEILAVLSHPEGTRFGAREIRHLDHGTGPPDSPDSSKPPFRVPPAAQAIAGVLITEWAHGRAPRSRRIETSKI